MFAPIYVQHHPLAPAALVSSCALLASDLSLLALLLAAPASPRCSLVRSHVSPLISRESASHSGRNTALDITPALFPLLPWVPALDSVFLASDHTARRTRILHIVSVAVSFAAHLSLLSGALVTNLFLLPLPVI